MNGRKFDKNADQLCQIVAHYRLLQRTKQPSRYSIMIENAIVMLEAILDINDDVGKAEQKGVL